ncbi:MULTISPECIES: permease prefix domain 1-containing protein [unclassified Streptomyces]|uniref:permease prefix domain 1-containing protein n=1 Tax=unclassified Streptomyces TaxID=2593676 RepID=UPI002E775597|nr:permease prefix domain 1-containing protein [Streptomyces sp. JV176]MEE1798990.1 permease prefix domain 1-containing protein [Streptomyces sp. JV176]
MSTVSPQSDPVEDYVASLAAALHGPARAKDRMVAEVREGLTDAVSERTRAGLTYQRAADQAMREFGTTDELVVSWQRELTIAQARHTARAVALTIPFVIACWYLVRQAGDEQTWQLPRTAQLLAVHLAGVSAAAALLAAVTLAATGTLARWLPTPDRLPLTVAWAGTTASVSMAVATLALAIAAALGTNWLLLAFAGALAATSHGLIASSARSCRRCARLPLGEP